MLTIIPSLSYESWMLKLRNPSLALGILTPPLPYFLFLFENMEGVFFHIYFRLGLVYPADAKLGENNPSLLKTI